MISPLRPRRCILARSLGPQGRPSVHETDVSSAHESRRRCGRLDRPTSGDCSACRTKPNSAKRRCEFLEGDRVDDPHQLRKHEPSGPRQHRWHQSQPRTTYRGQPQAVDVVSLNEIVIGTIGILTWRSRSEKSKGWERRWGRRRPTGAPGPVRLRWFGHAKLGRTPTSRDTLTPNVDSTACRRLVRTGRARARPESARQRSTLWEFACRFGKPVFRHRVFEAADCWSGRAPHPKPATFVALSPTRIGRAGLSGRYSGRGESERTATVRDTKKYGRPTPL